MEKVKCLRYISEGMPVFEYIEKNEPGFGEVGIRIIASSLCNTSELRSYIGGYKTGYGATYPMLPGEPGHEAIGKVISLGEGVHKLRIDDLVVMTGHGGDPCHRSYVIRKEKDISVIKPGDRNPEEAAMLEMFGCAYHCAMAPGGESFYKGKKVLVIGMGSMGLCSIQILKGIEGIEITASDISKDRLEIGRACGADFLKRPDELWANEKFDVIIECSGSTGGQETACKMAPKTLIFSSYSTKEIKVRQNLWFDANTTIYNPGILTSENFIKTVELYNSGKLNPSLLISSRINASIEEYNEAIEQIRQGRIIKTLMIW
jgi:threonine dehydrogenase-like Zn-dependent dehydrogenase